MPRLLFAFCLVAASGCSRVHADREGRPCDDRRCVGDYTCDAKSDTCIAAGHTCTDEGAASPCVYEATNCLQGCRICEAGAWSECRVIGDECIPKRLSCNESQALITCDDAGFIAGAVDCGAPGCNATVYPPRCNTCLPSSTWCDGLTFYECDAYGIPMKSTDCSITPTACASGGTCGEVEGCGYAGVAQNGTACDSGPGDDGNWCNSACSDGVCVPVAEVLCDDLNDCTDDRCETSSGCTATPKAPGTPCLGTDADRCTSTCDAKDQCQPVAVDCTDTNPCTRDECDDGVCSHPAGNSGEICRPSTGPCDVEERCTGLSTTCPPDTPSMSVGAPATASDRQQVLVTVGLPCTGQRVTCTTSVARFCISGPARFENGTLAGFSGNGVSLANCGADGISADGCTDNDGGGDIMRLAYNNTLAWRSFTVDANGYSDLRIHLKAAFYETTNRGETGRVRACCGTGCNPTRVGIIASFDDGGQDAWSERPCRDPCTGAGYSLDGAFDGCRAVRTSIYWNASGNDKPLHIDDYAISGNAELSLSMVDQGDGTYTSSYRPCATGTITVTCVWDYAGGVTDSAITTIE